jgi:hypothetical protein
MVVRSEVAHAAHEAKAQQHAATNALVAEISRLTELAQHVQHEHARDSAKFKQELRRNSAEADGLALSAAEVAAGQAEAHEAELERAALDARSREQQLMTEAENRHAAVVHELRQQAAVP